MGYQEWKDKIQEQRSSTVVKEILAVLGKRDRKVDRSKRVRVYATQAQ